MRSPRCTRIDTAVHDRCSRRRCATSSRIREPPVRHGRVVVALLAVVSLVHALVLAISRNRRVLGVLKGLGFTRRQVGGTVAWHATVLRRSRPRSSPSRSA